MVGVGIRPPNVLGTPKPASSVMISSTLGAPLGGTTRGAHHGFDSRALSLITPPNLGSGGGSCFPLMVVVAPGDPGGAALCCAFATAVSSSTAMQTGNRRTSLKLRIERSPVGSCASIPQSTPLLQARAHPGRIA